MVIKVPDAKPDQLGFAGFFLPTAFVTEEGVSFSGDPELINPQLTLNSFYGDLGLDDGAPQNVFELDVKDLTPLNARNLDAGGITLAPGMSYTLPDGKGTISFDGVKRYVGVDIHHNPGQLYALIFALLAVGGLIISLYVNRRRVWVRTGTHEDGRTMVEYGLLARGEDHRLAAEAAAIRKLLSDEWQLAAEDDESEAPPASSKLPAARTIMAQTLSPPQLAPPGRKRTSNALRHQRNHGPVQRAVYAARCRHVHRGLHRLRLGPGEEQQGAARH